MAKLTFKLCIFKKKTGQHKIRRRVNCEQSCSEELRASHRARVSLISLLMVVLTEVPRVSVI